jgi:hypothetical protein
MVFVRAQTLENENDDDEAAAQAEGNLAAFRLSLIGALIDDDENDVGESDRAIIMTGVEMTRTEFDPYFNLK